MASEAKQKLTIWVKPRTAEYIRYLAQSKSLTISEAADALLETAFREDAELTGAELISVALKNEMRREFGALSKDDLITRCGVEPRQATRIITTGYEESWLFRRDDKYVLNPNVFDV